MSGQNSKTGTPQVRCDFPIESELAMSVETAREVSSNPEVLKRLAKHLAQQCFAPTGLPVT